MSNRRSRLCGAVWLLVSIGACGIGSGAEAAPLDFRALYERCSPSVVAVTAVETIPWGFWRRTVDLINPLPLETNIGDVFNFIFLPLMAVGGPLKAGGSGFIIDADGRFITNEHVVRNRNIFWATLHDGRVVRAQLIGADSAEDYAILKMDLKGGEKVVPARLGKSGDLRPGDAVFAIGGPLRLRQTMTTGVVSAVHRRLGEFGPFQDYIQTDVTIGYGSSGGPLFNAAGEVVGITSMMEVVSEQTGDITFSIPIDNVLEGKDRLKKGENLTRGYIGALIRDITPRTIEEHKLEVENNAGAVLAAVHDVWDTPVSPRPAHKAGLRKGDVIVRFGDRVIDSAHTLARAVLNSKPGDKVQVEYLRKQTRLKCDVVIAKRPDSGA